MPSLLSEPYKPSWPFVLNKDCSRAGGLIYYAPGIPGAARLFDMVKGNHASFVSPPSTGIWVPGKDSSKSALSFDGTAYAKTGNTSLGLNGGTACSVTFWMRSVSNADNRLVAKSISSGHNTLNVWFGTGSAKSVGWLVENTGLSQNPEWEDTVQINDSNWHHIACVWGANAFTSADGDIYVDGKIRSTTFTSSGYASGFTLEEVSSELVLGARPVTYGAVYTGLLEELCIYSCKLTPAQIWRAYDPATRWELRYQPGQRKYLLPYTAPLAFPPPRPHQQVIPEPDRNFQYWQQQPLQRNLQGPIEFSLTISIFFPEQLPYSEWTPPPIRMQPIPVTATVQHRPARPIQQVIPEPEQQVYRQRATVRATPLVPDYPAFPAPSQLFVASQEVNRSWLTTLTLMPQGTTPAHVFKRVEIQHDPLMIPRDQTWWWVEQVRQQPLPVSFAALTLPRRPNQTFVVSFEPNPQWLSQKKIKVPVPDVPWQPMRFPQWRMVEGVEEESFFWWNQYATYPLEVSGSSIVAAPCCYHPLRLQTVSASIVRPPACPAPATSAAVNAGAAALPRGIPLPFDDGNTIDFTDDTWVVRNSIGEVVDDFGNVPSNTQAPLPLSDGWQCYANFSTTSANTVHDPFNRVSYGGYVPQHPSTDHGQTIFLFPGLMGKGSILQPVLQWQQGQWSIASWFVRSTGFYSVTSRIPVSPGDWITAEIDATPVGDGKYNYTCKWVWNFTGNGVFASVLYPQTLLNVNSIDPLPVAVVALEVYSATACSDLPPNENAPSLWEGQHPYDAFFSTIVLTYDDNGYIDPNTGLVGRAYPNVSWGLVNLRHDCNQRVQNISTTDILIYFA